MVATLYTSLVSSTPPRCEAAGSLVRSHKLNAIDTAILRPFFFGKQGTSAAPSTGKKKGNGKRALGATAVEYKQWGEDYQQHLLAYLLRSALPRPSLLYFTTA